MGERRRGGARDPELALIALEEEGETEERRREGSGQGKETGQPGLSSPPHLTFMNFNY